MHKHEIFLNSGSEARRLLEDMEQAGVTADLTTFLLDYDRDYYRVTLVTEYDNQVITEYLGSEDYDYDEVITTNL
ncbi:hypothetical protein P4331_4 [Escherichia phage vB_EcolP_P433.1]|uniref:Uncharacterized protein n=1 Tax=Escherichia phage vB_EcolP_P433.1 TaxID=2653657 RepID=A0AAE6P0D2_9CAUD|nr:hypothetical protein P4331_4 [Escherichia phage vB_EcolP_P433.1]